MLKEAALALPRLGLLIPKVIADDRTPMRMKLALAGLGVYLISPILLDNWTGDVKTLHRLQSLARLISSWVPDRVKSVLFGRAVAEGRRRMESVEAD
jgi:hypothetical protein